MATINEFKANMTGGGARPNQFRVQLSFPGWVNGGVFAGHTSQFLCKATQLPGSNIENIGIFYRGRQVNFAGERNFQPWTMTIYNDNNFGIRDAFEGWQAGIQNYSTTGAGFGNLDPRGYQVQLNVYQLDRNDSVVKTYVLIDAYPTSISPIQLDFDNQNQIETFDVEFAYNYFVADSTDNVTGTSTNGALGVGSIVNTAINAARSAGIL